SPFHSYDANSRNFVDRAGVVYVYVWTEAGWLFQAKITPTANQRALCARFGWSVDLSGDTLVVGAPGDDFLPWANSETASTRMS
ncbi:FG-GAP repeat protein, partial [Escherichia coli]|uniref:FG-GAP repeat protein n=1 Tax=Escherichia coli TaxID=562 RepID=UPI0019626FE1